LALSVKDAWLAMLMSLKKLLPRVEVPIESSTQGPAPPWPMLSATVIAQCSNL